MKTPIQKIKTRNIIGKNTTKNRKKIQPDTLNPPVTIKNFKQNNPFIRPDAMLLF